MINRKLLWTLLVIACPGFLFADDSNTKTSDQGLYVVSYEAELQPLVINRIHTWTMHIVSVDGAAVENAEVTITGGMPLHDHGLPTMPAATTYLGDGEYLVEGVKFHMAGLWQITVSITVDASTDTVTFDVEI